jgi:antirestriction protein ArdC
VEQCDGLTLPEIEQPTTIPEIGEHEICESIMTGWENCPSLHLTSTTECRAYYRPATDSVHMLARCRFVDAPHYYSTLFHELIHSTRHESRLNRTFGDRFGDELYSKEELVAEMVRPFSALSPASLMSTRTATQPHASRTRLPNWRRITGLSFMPPPRHKERRIAFSATPSRIRPSQ